jgi:hypothetical protein
MTANEAIETLKLMQAQVEWEYPMEYSAAIDEAIKALEAQEWIPCKKRLPEDVEIGEEYPTVIFSTKDAVYCGFYEYYYGGNWWAAEDYIVNDVIAWKPLPEPYKENT